MVCQPISTREFTEFVFIDGDNASNSKLLYILGRVDSLLCTCMFVKAFNTTVYQQLVLSKQCDLWLVLMSMRDVWKSVITTSGEQFVTVVLIQMMPGQHVAKLGTLENLLVSNLILLTFGLGQFR